MGPNLPADKAGAKENSMSQTKKQIVLGHVYSVAVGGSYLPVRADKSLGHGRYEGTTVRPDGPGSAVKFTTDRVRGDGVPEAEWRAKRETAAAQKRAEDALESAAKATEKVLGIPVHAVKTKTAKKPAPQGKQPKSVKTGTTKERKPSGLDAAVAVLAEAGKPMNCGDVVKVALEKGYWQTNGKTPAATIYAAIIREIAAKGKDARFRKTDRGQFEAVAARQ